MDKEMYQKGPVMITCSMTAGVFKPHLSREERQRFRGIIEQTHQDSMEGSGAVLEGKNSLVFYSFLTQGACRNNPEETGGACVIVHNGERGLTWESMYCNKSMKVYEDESRIDPISVSERLNNSWSMAIVDDIHGCVHIGRDIAGAHSMYYYLSDDILYFASSLTEFRRFPFVIDPDAVSDFLHFLYVPAPRTIYQGVRAVLPGQIVTFTANGITEQLLPRKDFTEDDAQRYNNMRESEYVSGFEEYLKRSVQRACPTIGKTALFLSGGKDSSALAIAVKASRIQNVEAITLSFDDKTIDESEDARAVAQHLGIPFLPLKLLPSTYLKLWPSFTSSLGQPFGDPAAMPVYAAMKELMDGYDIYLDGTGNDRYFGFTTTWQEDLAWYIYRVIPGLYYLPWTYLRNGSSYTIDILKRTFSRRREEQFVSWKGWTADEVVRLTDREPNWRNNILYQMYPNMSSPMIHKTQVIGGIWEPEAAYRKVVQIASTMGKAVHFPYLDRDLVKYCEGLPLSLKYEGHTNKVIVRLLLQKYLPPKIVNKRKATFNFPKEYILATNNYEYLRWLLSPGGICKHNLVNPSIIKTYINRYINGDKGLEDRLWALVILHSWAEFGRA